MKYAAIFGSSKSTSDSKNYKDSVLLASRLVELGYGIKCGGYGGVMEAVSIGAKNSSGECIGIALEYFEALREENRNLTSKIVAKDLFERIKLLIDECELIVVMEGSIGTLNELFMVWCLKYINITTPRIVVIGEEYKKLKALDFIEAEYFALLEFYDDVNIFLEGFDAK